MLGNPGPTAAGACLYIQGLNSDPIQLKRPVSPSCNNYVGELNGIHLGLDWLDSQKIKNKEIHLFVDCQPAIRTIFSTSMPDANIALVVECRQMVKSLEETTSCLFIGSLAIKGYREMKLRTNWQRRRQLKW